jgi:hypothetical protein
MLGRSESGVEALRVSGAHARRCGGRQDSLQLASGQAVWRWQRVDDEFPSHADAADCFSGTCAGVSLLLTALPNVEVTGARRRGALAARQMMNPDCFAARVPCRSASG